VFIFVTNEALFFVKKQTPIYPKINHSTINVMVKNTDYNPFHGSAIPETRYYFKRQISLRRLTGMEYVDIPYESWIQDWENAISCLELATGQENFMSIQEDEYHNIVDNLIIRKLSSYIP
jgi:hypothetical protein